MASSSTSSISAPLTVHAPTTEHESVPKKITKVAERSLVDIYLPLEISRHTGLSSPICSLIVLYSEAPQGYAKLQALFSENVLPTPGRVLVPPRRICQFGGYESERTMKVIENTVFITPDEIVEVHPVRFLRHSPFMQITERIDKLYQRWLDTDPIWESVFDHFIRQMHAVSSTESGRHVILQQAGKSCVATSIAMLVLDHGQSPDYEAIKGSGLANKNDAVRWVERAGLKAKVTNLRESSSSTKDTLFRCIAEHGPGALSINHPVISGHTLVLDGISIEKNRATIRDPLHGWAVTMKLDNLIAWIEAPYHEAYFLQIVSS